MKTKHFFKKIRRLTAFALMVCIVMTDLSVAHAELTYEDLLNANSWLGQVIYVPFDREIASEDEIRIEAGKTYTYPFKLYKNVRTTTVNFRVELQQATDFEVKLLRNGELYKGPFRTTADSDNWDSTGSTMEKNYEWEIGALKEETDFAITITYKDSVDAAVYSGYSGYFYRLYGEDNLTKGFTCQPPLGGNKVESYEIKNAKLGVTCISYNKATNTVKGIRVGSSTLVLTLSNNAQISIGYNVTKNQYQRGTIKKPTKASEGWSNKAVMKPYHAAFDTSGNLVVNAAYINNTSKTVKKKNIQVTVRDKGGKLIGSATGCKNGITVAAKKVGYATFTIKKSALKQQNVDIAEASITFSGCTSYRPVIYDREMTLPTTGVKVKVGNRYNGEGLYGESYETINENCEKLAQKLYDDAHIEDGTMLSGGIELYYNVAGNYVNSPRLGRGEIELRKAKSKDYDYELEIERHFHKGYNSSYVNSVPLAGYNQDALLMMLAAISSTPQKVYEGIYDVCYGEKMYQAETWYTFGDCKIKFKKQGYQNNEGIDVTFCIKEK